MPASLKPPLARRLSLLSSQPIEDTLQHLQELVEEAQASPAFDAMADLCRTLSDRNRLLIASMLKRASPLTASEIEAATGLSQATVSHHMRALVDSGLVGAERTGKWVYYRLDESLGRLVP